MGQRKMRHQMLVVFLTILIAYIEIVHGARRIDVKKRLTDFLSQSTKRNLDGGPDDLYKAVGLDGKEILEGKDHIITEDGKIKTKYQETYGGLEVVGETVVIEQEENGELTGEASGRLLEGIDEDIPSLDPALTCEDALEIALETQGTERSHVTHKEEKDCKLQVYTDNSDSGETVASLSYRITFRSSLPGHPSKPIYMIDATTGEILNYWEGVNMLAIQKRTKVAPRKVPEFVYVESFGGNERAGKIRYGGDLPLLEVKQIGETCYLENDIVKIIDMEETTDSSIKNESYSFVCSEGIHDSVNGAYSPMSDAYYYANMLYDMYTQWYNVTPLQELTPLSIYVHYGESFENAFWVDSGNFGDGNATFYPLTNADVMGHEIGHGIVAENSGLVYAGQSGGLNEAFADMSGETLDFYMDNLDGIYVIGDNMFKNLSTGGLRYLDDPEKDGSSIIHQTDYCPGMDVHYSSGIYNKVFYLLSNKPSWDVRSAFHIFVLANRMYWHLDSDFDDAACGVVHSAEDLGYNVADVHAVFQEVGIEPCVSRKTGFQKTFHLSSSKPTTLTFTFTVSRLLPFVMFQAFSEKPKVHGQVNLEIQIPDGEIFTSSIPGTSQEIKLNLPPFGKYKVRLSSPSNFSGVNFYALTHKMVLAKNVTNEEIIGNATTYVSRSYSFDLDANTLDNNTGILVRAITSANITGVYLLIRHEKPVNVYSMLWDQNSRTVGERIQEILFCSPKPGKYYIQLASWAVPIGHWDLELIYTAKLNA